MTHRPRSLTETSWSRPRLRVLMVVVGLVGLALLVGLSLFVQRAVVDLTTAPDDRAIHQKPIGTPTGVQSHSERRDALAAAPMLAVSPQDARSGEPAALPAHGISVPDATVIGPAKVPAGFPHTAEGAVGQLAAIEVAVLSSMSVAGTREVYGAWADPEAAPVTQWPLLGNVRAFLGAAGMGAAKDVSATVEVAPVAGQVKASDGPDWTIACVLVDVRAVIAAETRMAYGYCERMQWRDDRWVIAPGLPAALAPSTWPGTDLAAEAGWLTWPAS